MEEIPMTSNRRIPGAILSVIRNLVATIVGIIAGGIVGIVLVVGPLEAFHTKNGLVTLIVFAIGIYGGCVSALFVRRAMLSWLL